MTLALYLNCAGLDWEPVGVDFAGGQTRDANWRAGTNAMCEVLVPTIVDFSIAGHVYYPAEETGFDITTEYPALHAWRQRLAALPGWKPPYELMPVGSDLRVWGHARTERH